MKFSCFSDPQARRRCCVVASRFFFVVALLGLTACTESSSVTGPMLDASVDSGIDADVDPGMDADVDPGLDAGTDAGPSERRIFVTSTVHTADLGGIDGADAICAASAAAASLEGEFKAWLSTRTSSVTDRLIHSTVPYVLVDGTAVANDWDDLVDGSLLHPINLDATGTARTGDAWTGTLADGTPYLNDDCQAFASPSTGNALCGDSGSATATWTASQVPACSTRLRLYCVEQ